MFGPLVRRQFAGEALRHARQVRFLRVRRITGYDRFAPLRVRHADHRNVNELPSRLQDGFDPTAALAIAEIARALL